MRALPNLLRHLRKRGIFETRARSRGGRIKAAVAVLATVTGCSLLFVPAAAYAGTGAQISALALDNVGKKACSTNSLGGSYYYTSCTGNGGSPEYWCADFAKWVWDHEGIDDISDLTPAAHSFYTYGQAHGTLTSTPAIGDAVVFSNSTSPADIHHVAIVSSVSGGNIETVSGDWGGESGTEAHFASTSHVVHNPSYSSSIGYKSTMGMYLIDFIKPVGVTVPTGPQNSGSAVYTGNYHVFGVKAASGDLFQDIWTSSWSGWQALGGVVAGAPGVTYHDGRYDVFAPAPSGGAMYQKTFENGAWGDWHSIGGNFTGGAAAIYANGDYHVFGISPAGTLFQNTWNGSWGGWQNLGGTLTGTPAVTYHDGRFDVFGPTPGGGAMYQKTFSGGSWGDWHSIGGGFAAGDGAGAAYDGTAYHVFGISPAGTLFQNTWNGSWGGWQSIGGTLTGTPSITYHSGRFDVFAQSPAGVMYQKTFDGSWGDWHSIGGDFS